MCSCKGPPGKKKTLWSVGPISGNGRSFPCLTRGNESEKQHYVRFNRVSAPSTMSFSRGVGGLYRREEIGEPSPLFRVFLGDQGPALRPGSRTGTGGSLFTLLCHLLFRGVWHDDSDGHDAHSPSLLCPPRESPPRPSRGAHHSGSGRTLGESNPEFPLFVVGHRDSGQVTMTHLWRFRITFAITTKHSPTLEPRYRSWKVNDVTLEPDL